MTEAPKKRRPIWRFLSIVAAVLLVLVGSAALWIHSTAERKVAAMEDTLRALDAESRIPDTARRPGAEAGNAWDDYLLALTEAAKLKQPDKLIGIVAGTQNADIAFGDAALAAHGSAIDHLVRGSRRVSCVPPAAGIGAFRHWDTALRLAVLRARNLMKEGKAAEAVEIHLALGQFGRDVGQGGNGWTGGYGLPILEKAFEALRDDLASPSLTPAAIAELDSRLKLLDDVFPGHDILRRQRIRFLGEHYPNFVKYSGAVGSLRSWRFGFSSRLLAATAVECWDHWIRRAMEADRRPWLEARTMIDAVRAEIDAHPVSKNDLYGFPPQFLDDGHLFRSARTHLRLLRAAAHYRRTGERLDLDDPFGTTLLYQESGGRLKVWSVGPDGVDQQGLGNWDSRVIEDVVLEVPR